MRYLGLTGCAKPPRMACVQARYSRRRFHDHSRQCSCPTDPPDRPYPRSATPPSRTTPLLLREVVLEGVGDHDRQALAQGRRTARRAPRGSPEMQKVRQLLFEGGRFPSRRTFERRLKALPEKLPEQI